MSQGGPAAIREAIEAKRSKIKTPGVSLKTLERDAKRKKAWYENGEKAGARPKRVVHGRDSMVGVDWLMHAFEETALCCDCLLYIRMMPRFGRLSARIQPWSLFSPSCREIFVFLAFGTPYRQGGFRCAYSPKEITMLVMHASLTLL